MADEETFQRALDERPDDFDLRGVFGDWLAERGDPRAEGYWWMARERRRPRHEGGPSHFGSWISSSCAARYGYAEIEPLAILSDEICRELRTPRGAPRNGPVHWLFESRREAEEALCRVIHEQQLATVPV